MRRVPLFIAALMFAACTSPRTALDVTATVAPSATIESPTATTPATVTAPTPSAQTVRATKADDGTTKQVHTGDTLVIELPSGETGDHWEHETAPDPRILGETAPRVYTARANGSTRISLVLLPSGAVTGERDRFSLTVVVA